MSVPVSVQVQNTYAVAAPAAATAALPTPAAPVAVAAVPPLLAATAAASPPATVSFISVLPSIVGSEGPLGAAEGPLDGVLIEEEGCAMASVASLARSSLCGVCGARRGRACKCERERLHE